MRNKDSVVRRMGAGDIAAFAGILRWSVEEGWANFGERSASEEELRGVWDERRERFPYFVGEVDANEIFGAFESDAAYEASGLGNLSLGRKGLLTEALFYDAILAKVRGDSATMRARLEQTYEAGRKDYFEYKMARYLLNRAPVPKRHGPSV